MPIALTRPVSPSLDRCELTHVARVPIDVARASRQHEAYEYALRSCGYEVLRVPGAPDHPDAVFVEDTLIVVDEIAVATRPGAASRRAEVSAVAECAARFRPVAAIEPPGTLDGGDVLHVGRRLIVGLSGRTNADGLGQLRALLLPFGYAVSPVEVRGCLHLKSAVTLAGDGVLLLNPEWVDPAGLGADECRVVEVDPGEPHAANVLRAGKSVIAASAFPRTRHRLEAAGLRVISVDVSELAKAEGAVTCCSVLFD
jgi:dimethylargininase